MSQRVFVVMYVSRTCKYVSRILESFMRGVRCGFSPLALSTLGDSHFSLRVFYVVYVEVAIFLFNFRASFVKIVQGFLIKFEVYGCFILNIKYWSQVLHQPMVTL